MHIFVCFPPFLYFLVLKLRNELKEDTFWKKTFHFWINSFLFFHCVLSEAAERQTAVTFPSETPKYTLNMGELKIPRKWRKWFGEGVWWFYFTSHRKQTLLWFHSSFVENVVELMNDVASKALSVFWVFPRNCWCWYSPDWGACESIRNRMMLSQWAYLSWCFRALGLNERKDVLLFHSVESF